VEDNIADKQWVHDGHTKIVSMTSTVGEFAKKICRTADQAIIHHYTAKSTSFISEDVERNYSVRR
jgi:hypothetical protein